MLKLTMCFALFASCTLVGCGSSNDNGLGAMLPIGGFVKYNGIPLADADVTLIDPDGKRITVRTMPDGRYSAVDEIKTGEIKVCISRIYNGAEIILPRYSSPDQTELRCNVSRSGGFEYNFDLIQ